MWKVSFALFLAFLLWTATASAGDTCSGIVHVGNETTTVAGTAYLGATYDDEACKFATQSKNGKRVLKICPDGSRCEIDYIDTDNNGNINPIEVKQKKLDAKSEKSLSCSGVLIHYKGEDEYKLSPDASSSEWCDAYISDNQPGKIATRVLQKCQVGGHCAIKGTVQRQKDIGSSALFWIDLQSVANNVP